MIRIRRGMELPVEGAPAQSIETACPVRTVAVLGPDYHGMKPTMAVQVGDRVKLGQILFSDKKNPGVHFTSPAAGTVAAINRGAQRVLQSVVIQVEEGEEEVFAAYADNQLEALDPSAIRENLLKSGLWTALRTRPFSKVPHTDATPASIFVTAMDTHPLSGDPALIIAEHTEDFRRGLRILSRIAPVVVCAAEGSRVSADGLSGVRLENFSGPHPAGLPGTHIHFIDPVSANHSVWQIYSQDVIAIGKLFSTGRIWVERVVALGGPVVKKPRLLRTRLGASLDELSAGELEQGNNRVVSGSLLGGRTAHGPYAYLGRYHSQVSCLKEGNDREFMHWARAGVNKHSILNVFVSKLFSGRKFKFTTTTNGSPRAIVPVGSYEEVMPLDILPTQLLRYLVVGDTDMAQKLGCLELDEEDLALCTYVCAGKYEYGPILRDVLNRIEKEG